MKSEVEGGARIHRPDASVLAVLLLGCFVAHYRRDSQSFAFEAD
jgi:hypothetical protein